MRLSHRGQLHLLLSSYLFLATVLGCSQKEDETKSTSDPSKTVHSTGDNSGGTGTGAEDGPDSSASGDKTTAQMEADWLLDESSPPDSSRPTWSTLQNPIQPGDFWNEHKRPLPTNTWWLGFVLEDGDATVFPYPYYLRAISSGLQFGLPHKITGENAVTTGVGTWIDIGASESLSEHTIREWHDLSVTLEWTAPEGSMFAPIVSGMPYVTLFYEGLTPSLGIDSLNGTGQRFEFTQGESDYVVYASSELSFTAGLASAPFTGSIRVAAVLDSAAGETLDSHAEAIPLRGQVELSTTGDTATVELLFPTDSQDAPLMMALPHHRKLLVDTAESAAIEMPTIKGTSTGIVENSWRLQFDLGDVSFRAPGDIDPEMLEEVRTQLALDATQDPNTDGNSVYWAGKDLSKLARLALIAEEVGETEIQSTLLNRLKPKVEAWLGDGTALGYDETWGGVVNSCVSSDINCDFGQGIYSDHHFHYGYHVYAAAVIARLDSTWADEWGDAVGWLIRDYANPYQGDADFPRFRHFDFYSGHSWTSGLINFGSGRNQESTSEAVHGYYAVQLWGEATGNEDLKQVGNILRISESISAQTYWQIRDNSEIYDAPFSQNPAVGILWNDKVDFGTWFGTGDHNEYITGIQIIPITPASEDLLSPAWVEEAWDRGFEDMCNSLTVNEGWRDFIAGAVAGWDKTRACQMIREQESHDGGNSKTNMLHYCATR